MSDPTHSDGLDVSRETRDRLETLLEMLGQWNRRINLVSPASLGDGWRRHILDSAQFWWLACPTPDAAPPRHWVDLGSGGGFPGLVIATIAAERAPDCRVTMIDSDARKGAFVTAACARLGLAAEMVVSRIEHASPAGGDVVSARALAPLPRLLDLAVPHLAPGGRMLLAKGREHVAELTETERGWHIECRAHPSRTSAESAILEISGARRRA